MSQLGQVAEHADQVLKAYLQDFDRDDSKMVGSLFKMVQNENIYARSIGQGANAQPPQFA